MIIPRAKVFFLGGQQVGKSSIIRRLVSNQFTGTEQPTIGTDHISLVAFVHNRSLRLQLWDISGKARVGHTHLEDTQVAIIVFDVTSRLSFQLLEQYASVVRQCCGNKVLIYVLDLQTREVTREEAQAWFSYLGIQYFEFSARLGTNAGELLNSVSHKLLYYFDKASEE